MSAEAANYALRVCNLRDGPARHVLTALAWRGKTETPHQVYMKHGDLMDDTGMKTVGGIKRIIRRLVAANEVRVVEVGGRVKGRALATDYELIGVRQWISAGKPERRDWSGPVMETAKVLRGADAATAEEGKVLPSAEKVSPGVGKVLRGAEEAIPRNTHKPDSSVNYLVEPAPAASPPSPPTSLMKKGGEQNRAEQPSPPSSEALPQSRSAREQKSASQPNLEHGAAAEMPQKRIRQIASACPGDEPAWRNYLEGVPEFKGKDIDAVIRDYANYCRQKGAKANRYQFVCWLNQQSATLNINALSLLTAGRPKQTPLERSLQEMRRKFGRETEEEREPALGTRDVARFMGEEAAAAVAEELAGKIEDEQDAFSALRIMERTTDEQPAGALAAGA
jgi:HEPN domain-containing protein